MKFKVLLPVVLIVSVLLFLPAMVLAGGSPFYVNSSAEYYDGAEYYDNFDDDGAENPFELPINSSTWVAGESQYAEGMSEIWENETGFGMYVHAYADNWDPDPSTYAYVSAEATHWMRIDQAADSYLQISYDFQYDLFAESYEAGASAYHQIAVYLYVYGSEGSLYDDAILFDRVDALNIGDDSKYFADSGTIYVPITVGNWYNVGLMVDETAYAAGDAFAGMDEGELNSLYFDYEVTVVPEPVSSALFLVGAATLGYRSFRKKRTI